MSADTPKIQNPEEVEVRGATGKPAAWTSRNGKHEGREEVHSDLLHDLPDWLQEFRENLVDESSPLEPRGNPAPKDQGTSSSSHELPMESRAKVEPGSGVSIVSPRTFRRTQIAIYAWK